MKYIYQSPSKQWREIEAISQQMHEFAMTYYSDNSSLHNEQDHSSVWHDLATLDSKRLRLLNSFFDQIIDNNEKEFYKEKIIKLLSINNELIDISSLVQKNISSALSIMGKQQHAVSAYGNIQSL